LAGFVGDVVELFEFYRAAYRFEGVLMGVVVAGLLYTSAAAG